MLSFLRGCAEAQGCAPQEGMACHQCRGGDDGHSIIPIPDVSLGSSLHSRHARIVGQDSKMMLRIQEPWKLGPLLPLFPTRPFPFQARLPPKSRTRCQLSDLCPSPSPRISSLHPPLAQFFSVLLSRDQFKSPK